MGGPVFDLRVLGKVRRRFEHRTQCLLGRAVALGPHAPWLHQRAEPLVQQPDAIPEVGIAGSVIEPSDYDNDGDIDLFLGGRVITGRYPYPASSLLLINEGGKFTFQNDELAPQLSNIGLVTDAQWVDINNDEKIDLVMTGDK